MSSDGVAWVFRHSPYTGATLGVHLAIGDSVNDQNRNEFWMAQGTLAVKARVTRSTVKAAVDRMVADGYLAELASTRTGHGGTPVRRFRFLFPSAPVVYESRWSPDSSAHSADTAKADNQDNPPDPSVESTDSQCVLGTHKPKESTQESQNLRGASSEAPEELFPEPAPPPKPAPPTRPRSATTSQTATRPERRPEPRPAWDALVAEKGCAPETKSEKNRLGKVLKEITEALRVEYPDISPLEEAKAIHARANRYKQRYGADRFTETALMNHWAECGPRARLVDAPGPAPG